MTAASVSVIVPLYNGSDVIEACLDSVPAGVELIVVNDASTDDTPALVAHKYPNATLLHNATNAGFATTANRGLEAASGDVRVVLNSDARLHPGALDALVAPFADDKIGVAGPRLTFPDGSYQATAGRFPTVARFVAGSVAIDELYTRLRPGHPSRWGISFTEAEHQTSRDVDWVNGACLAISAECFAATGGFDTEYRMYVEECDLCWRAAQAGFRVRYVADATVDHIGGASGSGDPARQATFNIAGEARFMERAYGKRVLPRWRAARLTSSALKAAMLAPLALFDRRLRDRLRWHTTAVRVLAHRDGGR